MTTLGIVSCTAHKRSSRMSAENLYSSDLFFGSRRYAQARFDHWLILSAKHGLLQPGDQVVPYDQSVSSLTHREFQNLTRSVRQQFFELARDVDTPRITSLCSEEYDAILSSAKVPFAIEATLRLPPAEKLSALKHLTDPSNSEADLDALYAIIDHLAAKTSLKPLRDAIRTKMPESGIYLFFDNQERRLRDIDKLRLVRIGTHGVASGSRATLKDRIRTHFGTATGQGNHRSSIFRLHVGRCAIRQGIVDDIPSWGSDVPSARQDLIRNEMQLERFVSDYIGNLLVAFVEVPGEADKSNDRAYLEQNLIALVSNSFKPLDPPSHRWLGSSSDKQEVRKSGLWNVNHTTQAYDAGFLAMFAYYVSMTVGEKPTSSKPVAPLDWAYRARTDQRQFSLF